MSSEYELSADELPPPGRGRVVELGGREVALFNRNGEIHALENTCCHRGGPLGDGSLQGSEVSCPWHGWRFDLETGECLNSPGDRVRTYTVDVEDDIVRVRF